MRAKVRIPGKHSIASGWHKTPEGRRHAPLLHIQPNIAGRRGDGSMESWDRQREGRLWGPDSPQGRQQTQTAWNVARFQNGSPQRAPDAALPPSLYHTSDFHHCFLSVSCALISFPNLTSLHTLQLLRRDSGPVQTPSGPTRNR